MAHGLQTHLAFTEASSQEKVICELNDITKISHFICVFISEDIVVPEECFEVLR